jgi:hypothetical protein
MQATGVRGTIIQIDRRRQRGTIRGDDGDVHRFEREGMIYWLQFDELNPPDRMRFDVETTGSAVNVERVE